MDAKMMIRSRKSLSFKYGDKFTTTNGKIFSFVRMEIKNKNICHYVFFRDGRYYSFKMNVFPFLSPVNLQMYKRDEIGNINVLNYNFLLSEIRNIRAIKEAA